MRPPVTFGAIDVLARTLWGEARGEPAEGKIAVAWVICNRVAKPRWWGRDVISVCRKPWQFSCWNENDPNRTKLLAVTPATESFLRCIARAAGVLAGIYTDPTGGATHYLNPHLADPDWDDGMIVTARIGRHVFFKEN